jgi:CDP-diacylglycerol--serine O-phosphatidyltransferase
VIAIVIAAVFDGLDGRIARLLDSTSRFGAELDSLSDFVSFGVAPAMLLYFWNLQLAGSLGWAAVLLYCVCCGLRLARFNTKIDNADLPAWTSRFFMGVPAPAAAGIVLLPMIASFEFGREIFGGSWFVGMVVVAVALLMISRLPTYSFKRIKVAHHLVLPTLIGVGAFAAFLVSSTWNTLIAVGLLYLASIPASYVAHRRLARVAPKVPAEDLELEEPEDRQPR